VAYNEDLADWIMGHLAGQPWQDQRKMFGGLSFMTQGNLACAVAKNELCARLGLDRYEAAPARPHAGPMDFTGKPMCGCVLVGAEAPSDDASLYEGVDMDLRHALCPPGK